jgi:putative lipoprotein (rSAM/lipoprotein system)
MLRSRALEKGTTVMKFLHRCWCLLLGALLPSACSDNANGPTPEYGMPLATVNLDGEVVDVVGAPVRDIVVELDGFGSTTSDASGKWSLNGVGFNSCVADSQITCGLVAKDVDGAANGGPFPPTLTVLDLEQTAPGGGWSLGTFEQHDVKIVMEDVAIEYGPQCVAAKIMRETLNSNES